ncbi:starvation-inducible DNA-binding protein [Carnobacterium iners]|uniref:Starvation-inducible DNA-binding protein n=1 Tax=Carnobacterium iners TaxID=1073423 RepID=A0A1X7MY23_9LACT|nr:DNA starvation/stationary phase protection protein [Carnobacterium iners]SEK17983.1 starvation-inducible DNA-binding protein [Carnobacterium iners]SMH29369.1 starvation-inducible DNA-binding protein [Carnobacterium iners]
MTKELTKEELVEQEFIQDAKEHNHHNPTAAAMANHIIANQGMLHIKLHQYHWYIKGANFFSLHKKFEELYKDNESYFDGLGEHLIASGSKPFSTAEQFVQYSFIPESAADKYLSAEKMVGNLVDDYRTTRDVTGKAIVLAQNEKDAVLEDLLIDYNSYLNKTIWMLQAFLGKSALEGEDDDE